MDESAQDAHMHTPPDRYNVLGCFDVFGIVAIARIIRHPDPTLRVLDANCKPHDDEVFVQFLNDIEDESEGSFIS